MRFDSARAAGLNESRVELIDDRYAETLSNPEVAALELTDLLIGLPSMPDEDLQQRLHTQFSTPEIVELALGVGLFHGMSKVLITLGLEPEEMATTVVPAPGSKVIS